MKTTQECWQALIDGKKLRHLRHGEGSFVALDNGSLVDKEGVALTYNFNYPDEWSIYTPPKWYDNIPEGGVLCWLNNNGDRCQRKGVITRYSQFEGFLAEDEWYQHATPLTKQEIQTLLDNAPEGEEQ